MESVPVRVILAADSPRLDGESTDHIRTLACSDAVLPPIVVHRPSMRVIDGMHRLAAARRRNQEEIDAQFFDGGENDVFALSVDLNTKHGLPLTRADRGAAATRIIRSHPHWSDRMIAGIVGLSPKTVGSIRRRSPGELPAARARIGRDGRTRPIDGAECRRATSEFVIGNPGATLREIAERVGVSITTAQDVRARVRRGENPLLPGQRRGQAQPTAVRNPSVGLGAFLKVAKALTILQRDPSVRLTDQGRLLLRALGASALSPTQWSQLIHSVPSHCAATVSNIAQEYAEGWQIVAQRFAERARSTSGPASQGEPSRSN